MTQTYVFGCPVCRKTFRIDAPGEPCCTGPSESRDEHSLTVMRLLRVDTMNVHPEVAERRVRAPLIV